MAGTLSLTSIVAMAQKQTPFKNNDFTNLNDTTSQTITSIDSLKYNTLKNKIYPYKNSKPTTKGITEYITEQAEIVIIDFQNFFNVEIDYMDFVPDKVSEYIGTDETDIDSNNKDNNSQNVIQVTSLPTYQPAINPNNELGVYLSGSNYAVISNEDKYLDYSYKNVKKRSLSNILETNKFVRSVMLHELAHDYFKQVVDELKNNKTHALKEYSRAYYETFSSTFIEEAIAEYCVTIMGEIKNTLPLKEYKPQNISEISDKANEYKILYKYGAFYVNDFLKTYGLHEGIKIIITNPPPTLEEILIPEKYFSRLKTLIE